MFPVNSQDQDLIADELGNIYQYDATEDTWTNLGIRITNNIVNENRNGIVDIITYNLLQYIKQLIADGIDFNKTKIFIGNKNNPYFYYFHSTDNTVKIEPYKSDKKYLKIEVNKANLINKLTKTPCTGSTGKTGIQGLDGVNGLSASNEKLHTPIINLKSIKIRTNVASPIDTPISLRIYQNSQQIIEILFKSEILSINSDLKIDKINTQLNYIDGTLDGEIFLLEGSFDNSTKYKARQQGPKGKPGKNGDQFLELINHTIDDSNLTQEIYISSLRTDRTHLNLLSTKGQHTDRCASTLKPVGKLPIGKYALAVIPTTLSCKKICFWTFEEEIKIPKLLLPTWRPFKTCLDKRITDLTKFDWYEQISINNPNACFPFSTDIGFNFKTEEGQDLSCCKDPFFMCPNTGDFCSVQGNPTNKILSKDLR